VEDQTEEIMQEKEREEVQMPQKKEVFNKRKGFLSVSSP
jgi:hypothetical protein